MEDDGRRKERPDARVDEVASGLSERRARDQLRAKGTGSVVRRCRTMFSI
jgi:hypothetical protein